MHASHVCVIIVIFCLWYIFLDLFTQRYNFSVLPTWLYLNKLPTLTKEKQEKEKSLWVKMKALKVWGYIELRP